MAHYRSCGDIPPKRHTQHRRPDGGLYYEELMGEEGFSSDSSLLYHTGVPSAIVDAMTWEPADQATTPNHPLKPRHLKLHDLFPADDWKAVDAVTGRRLVLGNADVRISYVVAGETSPLYRNAIGDECVYVEAGRGHRGDGVRRAAGPGGRLRRPAPVNDAPLAPGRARAAALLRDRGELPHRAAQALPVPVRAVPGARPVLRARPARAGRAGACSGHRRGRAG